MVICRLLLCGVIPLPESRSMYYQDMRESEKLHPAILRTCRQILSEARIILYSENTWKLRIWEEETRGRYSFQLVFMLNHFPWRYKYGQNNDAALLVPRAKEMRRWEIKVQVQDLDECRRAKRGVKVVCITLAKFCHLEYLHIILYGDDSYQLHRVLERFTLLRARKLDLTGVPSAYGVYLRSVITGSSPTTSDYDLRAMYQALKTFAEPFEYCETFLDEACRAMEHEAWSQFRALRKKIIASVEENMASSDGFTL